MSNPLKSFLLGATIVLAADQVAEGEVGAVLARPLGEHLFALAALAAVDNANKMYGIGGQNPNAPYSPFRGGIPGAPMPNRNPFQPNPPTVTPTLTQDQTVNQGILSKNNFGMVKSQFDPYPGAVSAYLKQKGVLPWQDKDYNADLFSTLISNNGETDNNSTTDWSDLGYYDSLDGDWKFYEQGRRIPRSYFSQRLASNPNYDQGAQGRAAAFREVQDLIRQREQEDAAARDDSLRFDDSQSLPDWQTWPQYFGASGDWTPGYLGD